MTELRLKKIFRKLNSLQRPFSPDELLPDKNLRKKDNPKKKGKRGKKNRNSVEVPGRALQAGVDAVLKDLVGLGVLEKDGSLYIPGQNQLTGRITFNRKGVGYVNVGSGIEVIIPISRRADALPGDSVEIKLVDKTDRYFGEVKKIIKRKSAELLFQVEGREYIYVRGSILDLPFDLRAYYYQDGHPNFRLADQTLLDAHGEGMGRKGRGALGQIKSGDYIKVKPLGVVNINREPALEVAPIESIESSGHSFDLERIAVKNGIPIPFSPGALSEVPTYNKISKSNVSDWKSRKDLRKLYTITIDGETAKDFDDAISIEKKRSKTILYVHIADVSYYVQQNGALDHSAVERGTSVYLQTEVIPMLPEGLSNELCSLKAGVNRLALTCEMHYKNGQYEAPEKYYFYPTIIKVDKRYTYKIAEGNRSDKKLKQMKEFAAHLTKVRSPGKLELDVPEIGAVYGRQNEILNFEKRESYGTNKVIEEFMLSANICAAHYCKANKAPVLHREHESMDEEKLPAINDFLHINGKEIEVRETTIAALQEALNSVKGSRLEEIFSFVVLRSFKQAHYSPEGLGHWGLGFADYAHFTSPIRRYPDLIVHRVIKALNNKGPLPYSTEELVELGVQLSEAERRAMDAERDMLKLKSCHFMMDVPPGTAYKALVMGVSRNRIFIQVQKPPVEGVIHAEYTNPMGEFHLLDDYTAVARAGAKPVFVGMTVQVYLRDVDLEAMRILFELTPSNQAARQGTEQQRELDGPQEKGPSQTAQVSPAHRDKDRKKGRKKGRGKDKETVGQKAKPSKTKPAKAKPSKAKPAKAKPAKSKEKPKRRQTKPETSARKNRAKGPTKARGKGKARKK